MGKWDLAQDVPWGRVGTTATQPYLVAPGDTQDVAEPNMSSLRSLYWNALHQGQSYEPCGLLKPFSQYGLFRTAKAAIEAEVNAWTKDAFEV